ncbi:hypothetical protein HYU12_01220 [Candidatus Woesearchaeota archaeon]|nr:hypothetical protein [Candidatus Woesearchaeota archaeon]
MKDPRFLPVEKREPVDDFDDDFLEEDELASPLKTGRGKAQIKKMQLFIAS